MKWLKRLAIALGLLLLLAALGVALLYRRLARPNEHVGETVSAADRDAEAVRLRALGLSVPDGGPVLERPYDVPLSSRAYVVPAAWIPPPPKQIVASFGSVRASALLRDLPVLRRAMERSYGGWESAERRGLDWARWFDDWRAALEGAGDRDLSMDEAFAPMDRLAEIRIDNHTNIPAMRVATSSLSQSARISGRPRAPCTIVESADGKQTPLRPGDLGEQPRRALAPSSDLARLEEVSYLALPSRLGVLRRVKCGDEWLDLAGGVPRGTSIFSLLRAERQRQEIEVRRLPGGVLYVRLPTFARGNYQDLDARARGWPAASDGDRALLFDLRGNGGGGSQLAWPVLDRYLDRKRLPSLEAMRVTVAKSCLYPALRWNLWNHDGEAWQPGLDALFAPAPEGCPRRLEVSPGTLRWRRGKPKQGLAGKRIVVWVDGGCGSDCEYLMQQLGALPETVVVGTNSGGVCEFIQPGLGVLPGTRLAFRFALGASDFYGDGRSVDGHGLDVDVLLRDDEGWTPEKVAGLVPLF